MSRCWVKPLRENYADYQEWESYASMFGLHKRLGMSIHEAWEANPIVKGSTNPADFGLVPVFDNLPARLARRKGIPKSDPGWQQAMAHVEGAALYYEYNTEARAANVFLVETEPQYRRQGKATLLVKTLVAYAKTVGWTIDWGAFTPQGQKFLRPVIEREQEHYETTL